MRHRQKCHHLVEPRQALDIGQSARIYESSKRITGGAISFTSIRLSTWSAPVRVATLAARARGGLGVHERAVALHETITSGDFMCKRIVWADWYKRSHVGVLHSAVLLMEQTGITAHEITSILARHASPPWALRHLDIIRKGF